MEQQVLSKGTVLGERFELESLVSQGDLGQVYKANDTKTGQSVSLRVIPSGLVPNKEDLDRLRARVKEVSELTHRNIQAAFGLGLEKKEAIYIATEWVDGQDLRTLLDKRARAGKRFSFKGAYNLMGHVCNALTYAHDKTAHGAVCPRAILVNKVGRVKVGDWCLSAIRTTLKDNEGSDKLESVFWAPEVLEQPGKSSARADIYSLGALFYELITGVAPQRPLKAPSTMGFSKDVNAVIARCMAAVPEQRYASAREVKDALVQLVQAHQDDEIPAQVDDDISIDVDIELDAADPGPPPKEPAPPVSKAVEPPSKPKARAKSMLDAPDLPPPPPSSTPIGKDSMARSSTIDMGEVLSSLSRTEAAHWMVQKDRFDHGPFTDRELVQMIIAGEVLHKHILHNMDTGVRKKVKAWGDFDEYLERYRIKKKEQEEKAALERTEKAESRSTMFKWAVVLGVVGVLILGGAAFFITRQYQRRVESYATPDDLIAALDSGEIKLKTGGNLIDKKRARRGGRRGGGRAGGGGGGSGEFVPGMSYEDAMNVAVDLGSAKSTGGQKQLTPEVISRVMDKNVRRFLPCVVGGSVKKVSMDIVIGGDGQVLGVTVAQGGAKLKQCVASKLRTIKFPTSPAPRTAASWYFELY